MSKTIVIVCVLTATFGAAWWMYSGQSGGLGLGEYCPDFKAKLVACEPYSCDTPNVVTNKLDVRLQIRGIEDFRCVYVQTSPDDVVTCRYGGSSRQFVADNFGLQNYSVETRQRFADIFDRECQTEQTSR